MNKETNQKDRKKYLKNWRKLFFYIICRWYQCLDYGNSHGKCYPYPQHRLKGRHVHVFVDPKPSLVPLSYMYRQSGIRRHIIYAREKLDRFLILLLPSTSIETNILPSGSLTGRSHSYSGNDSDGFRQQSGSDSHFSWAPYAEPFQTFAVTRSCCRTTYSPKSWNFVVRLIQTPFAPQATKPTWYGFLVSRLAT